MLGLFQKRHVFCFPLAVGAIWETRCWGLRMNYRINIDLAAKKNRASSGQNQDKSPPQSFPGGLMAHATGWAQGSFNALIGSSLCIVISLLQGPHGSILNLLRCRSVSDYGDGLRSRLMGIRTLTQPPVNCVISAVLINLSMCQPSV